MRLNVKATAAAVGVAWGVLAMLSVGLLRLAFPEYGQAYMEVMASIYPGLDAAATFQNALVGTLYGLLDGAIVGAVIACAYNFNVAKFTKGAA